MTRAEGFPIRPEDENAELDRVLRRAWIIWVVLLLVPFFAFVGVVSVLMVGDLARNEALGNVFFVISLLWLLVTFPGAFLLRDYTFRTYWEGRTVAPRTYLKGMVTVWLSAEIGGLIAILGCLLSGSLVPCVLPAAVAFVLFTPFWPKGTAMTDTVGASDDDQIYHEPQ